MTKLQPQYITGIYGDLGYLQLSKKKRSVQIMPESYGQLKPHLSLVEVSVEPDAAPDHAPNRQASPTVAGPSEVTKGIGSHVAGGNPPVDPDEGKIKIRVKADTAGSNENGLVFRMRPHYAVKLLYRGAIKGFQMSECR